MASAVRRVAPYGAEALLVELSGGVEPYAVAAALEAAGIGEERLCGWESVLVTGVDPTRSSALKATLESALPPTGAAMAAEPPPTHQLEESTSTGAAMAAEPPPTHQLEVRLAFRADGEDLEEVATLTAMSIDEVIEAFTTPTYRVVCLGFVRGFTYLAGLDPRLAALGRRSTPRRAVPAGSVAIGGGQAGIYPISSPGGWYLLGSTDAVLFDPGSRPPCRFAPGDRVRFG